jgi:hypothetical protein
MGRSMAWWISQNARLQRGAFWTGTDAEQDLLKAHPESFAWSAVVSLVMGHLADLGVPANVRFAPKSGHC